MVRSMRCKKWQIWPDGKRQACRAGSRIWLGLSCVDDAMGPLHIADDGKPA